MLLCIYLPLVTISAFPLVAASVAPNATKSALCATWHPPSMPFRLQFLLCSPRPFLLATQSVGSRQRPSVYSVVFKLSFQMLRGIGVGSLQVEGPLLHATGIETTPVFVSTPGPCHATSCSNCWT